MRTKNPILVKSRHALRGFLSGLPVLAAVVECGAAKHLGFPGIDSRGGFVGATSSLSGYGISFTGNYLLVSISDQSFDGNDVQASSAFAGLSPHSLQNALISHNNFLSGFY